MIKQEGDIKIFNFKRDVKSKNLWGGQIISRPYESKGLTFVLFDLKKGFKFEDKGHANEQITWLISGEMDFYTNNIRKNLITAMVLILALIIFTEVYLEAQ